MTKLRRVASMALVIAGFVAPLALAQSDSAARVNRHAVIIGVGTYTDARISSLAGVVHDVANAKRIAEDMGIPISNTRVLRDHDATYANIRQAFRDLAGRMREGDRVFIYYSGHGTRFVTPDNPNICREALIPTDVDLKARAGLLTQEDVASDLAPVYAKADKVFIFFDACHSGGVQASGRTRSVNTANDDDDLVPKFSAIDTPAHCRIPSNVRTRSVNEAAQMRGAPANNVVQLSSSRPDEISLDSPTTGGLATSAWEYCSRNAEDTDNSGALSISEIAACVQSRLNERLAKQSKYTGQHLVVAGNKDFAPRQTNPVIANSANDVASPIAVITTASVAAASHVPPMASAAFNGTKRFPLESVIAQSDARHIVSVKHPTAPLTIGRDYFNLQVKSSRGGFVHLILQSSDGISTYVLFPNALDQNNRIRANEWLALPRPKWRLQSQGPAGLNRLLVLVTDAPRDLTRLSALPSGPFVKTLNDRNANQSLSWLVGTSTGSSANKCTSDFASKDLNYVEECSDSFGARIIEFLERN